MWIVLCEWNGMLEKVYGPFRSKENAEEFAGNASLQGNKTWRAFPISSLKRKPRKRNA